MVANSDLRSTMANIVTGLSTKQVASPESDQAQINSPHGSFLKKALAQYAAIIEAIAAHIEQVKIKVMQQQNALTKQSSELIKSATSTASAQKTLPAYVLEVLQKAPILLDEIAKKVANNLNELNEIRKGIQKIKERRPDLVKAMKHEADDLDLDFSKPEACEKVFEMPMVKATMSPKPEAKSEPDVLELVMYLTRTIQIYQILLEQQKVLNELSRVFRSCQLAFDDQGVSAEMDRSMQTASDTFSSLLSTQLNPRPTPPGYTDK